MCRSSSSSLSHFLLPRDFSRTIADRDILNTPLEPLRPADLPFGILQKAVQNTLLRLSELDQLGQLFARDTLRAGRR